MANPDFDWQEGRERAVREGEVPSLFIDAAEHRQRMQACRSCADIELGIFCSHCKCFMPVKTWIGSASCPKGVWEAR